MRVEKARSGRWGEGKVHIIRAQKDYGERLCDGAVTYTHHKGTIQEVTCKRCLAIEGGETP